MIIYEFFLYMILFDPEVLRATERFLGAPERCLGAPREYFKCLAKNKTKNSKLGDEPKKFIGFFAAT